MRNSFVILLPLFALFSVGCADEETERVAPGAAAASPSVAAEPAVTPPAPAPPAPVAPVAPPAPMEAAPTADGTVGNTAEMQQVGVVIEAALAAAAAVPTEGRDRCGIAYGGLEAMTAHVRQAMPDQPINPLPQRDTFLDLCRALPQEVQQCMVVSHAIGHQEECERHISNLDPAVRARMEALMDTAR